MRSATITTFRLYLSHICISHMCGRGWSVWCQSVFSISLLNNKPIMWNLNKSLKCHRRWNVHLLSRSFCCIKAKRIAVSYLATDQPTDSISLDYIGDLHLVSPHYLRGFNAIFFVLYPTTTHPTYTYTLSLCLLISIRKTIICIKY